MKRLITAAAVALALLVQAPCHAADLRQAPGKGGGGMMVPGAQPEPQIRVVSPAQLMQGSAYTLQLIGVNLQAGMTLDFGPGIQVTGAPMLNGTAGSVGVQVAPGAAVGVHDVKITFGGKTVTALAKVIVTPAPSAPRGGGPDMPGGIMPVDVAPGALPKAEAVVLGVSPNNWEPGKGYDVMLTGLGFAEGMEVRFGNGVEVKSVGVTGPTSAKLSVLVAKDAAPGVRLAELRQAGAAAWKASNTPAWVVKPKGPQLAVGMPQIEFAQPELAAFQKGLIILFFPRWGNFETVEVKRDYGIPQINDATVFEWKEKNPGVADWFELRILRKNGDVLMTKRVSETYYRPEPAFMDQLYDLAKPSVASAGTLQETVGNVLPPSQGGPAVQLNAAATGQGPQPVDKKAEYIKAHWADVDLYWEVAGYRTYKKNPSGGASGQGGQSQPQQQGGQFYVTSQNLAQFSGPAETVDIEVELSERWPLGLKAAKPTGMACGQGFGTITTQKITGDTADPVMHPFDVIELSGNFNLKNSPWNISMLDVFDTSTPALPDAKAYKFNNVFVDWGDGTVVPLYSEPEDKHTYYQGKELSIRMSHKYAWDDQFTIRVYVLPSDDVGMLGEIADANANKANSIYDILKAVLNADASAPGTMNADAPGAPAPGTLLAALDGPVTDAGPGLYAAAGTVQQAAPSGAAGGMSGPAVNSSKLAPANPVAPPVIGAMDRAFMVYCNTVDIRPVMDTDATGPLHLDWIEITSFSGQPDALKAGKLSVSKTGSATVQQKTDVAIPSGAPKSEVSALGKALSALDSLGETATQTISASAGTMKELSVMESAAAKAGLNLAYDARATTCDEGLIATADLSFYGTGRVRVVWRVDGVSFPDEYDLASDPREGLPSDKSKWGEPKRKVVTVTSPILPVDKSGLHKVYVDAMVIPGKKTDAIDAAKLMGLIGGGAGKTMPLGDSPAPAGDVKPAAKPAVQGGGQKVGALSPAKNFTAGNPPVVYASQGLVSGALAALLQPPFYVKSGDKSYLVVQPDPEYPCVFHFPVKGGGYFRVTSLQGNVKKDASGRWSGHGTLLFRLPADETSYKDYFTDVKISGWEVTNDVDVVSGEINLTGIGLGIDTLPGMKARLDKLAATPGSDMMAAMDVEVGIPELKLVSSGTPKSWKGLSAPLTPSGDWYVAGQKLEETYIGWSMFKIASDDTRVDLSHAEGDGLYGNGASWVGIHLGGSAKLYPYLMDLQNLSIPAANWGISGGGINGSASMGVFDHSLGEGSVHFDSMSVKVVDDAVDATYSGVKIHVPWPDVTLTSGNAKLAYGPEGASIKFDFSSAGAFTLKYGPMDMTVNNIEFRKGKPGWGIAADTTFDFLDGTDKFATGYVPGLFYDMLGFATFEDGAPNHQFGLSGKSKLGKAPLDLLSVTVTPSAASSGERLKFAVVTMLSLSKSLEAAQVQVNYNIKRTSGNYYANGPFNSPFDLYVEYPKVNPVTKCLISPNVVPGGSGTAGGAMYASLYGPDGVVSDAYEPVLMAAAGGATDTFNGTVDSKMFGMAQEIKATFRLGYVGDDDYWITYASYSPHLQIFPGVELKTIGGGLGYNFGKDAYTTNPATATPVINGSMIFSADLTVHDPSDFAYSVHGVLTIIPGQSIYRMDFLDVKLLGINGIGQGYFEYGDSHFEGEVWGNLSLFGNYVYFEIPKGSTGLYFGSDKWYIKGGGAGHMLILDTTVNMALGSVEGLKLSGGFHAGTGKICLGVISGKFSVDGSVGFQVTSNAHLSTTVGIHASCKVCAACYKPCDSIGAGVDLKISVPPLSMDLCVDLDCPWPIPDYAGCFGI